MALIVADTDVLIDFLADRDPGASRIAAELDRGNLRTTVVARFELLSGARGSRQLRAIEDLLEVIPALPLDVSSADRAADVRRRLERRGEAIGMGDSLIAGIVLTSGGTLLSRNRRHFERVEGLSLVGLV